MDYYCWVNGSPAKTPSGPRLCGPMSPGWHTTWHWHGHSNHPDLSWGSLIQALASTQHHPLNFLVSQYTATQLCCWVHTSCGSGCWMVDVSVRGMESSQLQVLQKHQQPGSQAAEQCSVSKRTCSQPNILTQLTKSSQLTLACSLYTVVSLLPPTN